MTAIAIVGMGCRFAGAEDLSAYWRLTREGRDAFGPIPTDRWPAELFFDKNKRAVDKTYAPAGAFMKDIRSFPAIALGLPPRRVEVMDPQQRLALEVALDAVEDAGYMPSGLPRRTGVFMGITAQEFRSLAALRVGAVLMAAGAVGRRDLTEDDVTAITAAVERIVPSRPYTAPGGLGNMSAAIVAQELDLHGPAYTTDAACASAHMAVYDAVQQLRSGAIDAAIAGGAYVQILPDHYVVFSRIGAMSAQGLCLPFDARADGFVQGDGAGVVLLKRLDDAVRDGDRIYAVIRGVAINNDGRGDGPMAPNQVGQTEVIREAYADAGVDPSELGYHEAHGTGTSVGDPVEFAGIVQAVGGSARSVAIGSSKANVGHTMSAAGIAGLIRAVLAVHHRTIPPMANFRSPREDVRLDGSPFRIPTVAEPWTADVRIAGVSSFGFGGTNGHIVVANAPDAAPSSADQPELVLLSACDEAGLRALAARTARALQADPSATVAGVARAWALRRRQPARLGVVARTLPELTQALAAYGAGESPKGVRAGVAEGPAPRVAFLYPGQGAQRTGMLRGARSRFPTLRSSLDHLETELAGSLSRPLTHLLYPELRPDPVPAEQAEAELTDTEHCQPALLAVGLALTDLLAEVGVRPTVVTGHSLGEFVAASAAGVFDGGSAARFVAARGQAMAALPGDHGAMAAVMADRATTEALLVDGAVIANINHPRQLVVSGYADAVARVVARAEEAGVKAVSLQVSHGFHGPALRGLDSAPFLAGVALRDPEIVVASGISAEPYRDAEHAREVFLRHATSPVDFVRALEQCREAGADLYLQVGAGGPLASFARGVLPRDHRGIFTLAGREDDDDGASLLDTLAQLWVAGVDIDVRPIAAPAQLPSLPPSVLPREDYWPVKEDPQLPVEIPGIRAREATRTTVAPAPAPATPAPAAAASPTDDVESMVLAIIAKVSAYPREALRSDMSLVDDLGFDSLMVNDMATGLADAFPTIDGIPQELLINRPSVRDIVEFARGASTGATARVAHDDDEALTAWAVGWRPAPLSDLPGRTLTPGHRVLVVGDERVAAAWRAAGAFVTSTTSDLADHAGSADVVVWAAPPAGPGPRAVLAGEAAAPDPAAALISTLAAQARAGAHPDLLVLCDADDPWAGALCGVVRSLPREWPGASAATLHLAAGRRADAGPLSVAQWASADRTPDVLHAEVRSVPDLRPTPWSADPLGPDDVVLVTGGTRGIGLAAARRAVAAGARVILVGRGTASDEAAPLLGSGRAVAVAVDVADSAALAAAIQPYGPITRILHAAGVLADGPVEVVSPEAGAQARNVKVQGLLSAIRAAGPSLRGALVVGSWAGRFGNRHQMAYAAANAAIAALAPSLPVPVGVLEFGPWTSSAMASTIPAPVQAAMRAEGVDFVGDEAGQDAIASAWGLVGPRVLGRSVPDTTRAVESKITLSTASHPYLLDHAINGVPVLPLAAATDLMAWAAGVLAPWFIEDVRLFQGVTVSEPVDIVVAVRGDRAEIRFAGRGALAYRARVRSGGTPRPAAGPSLTGEAPVLPLSAFYGGITFHGPLLQGITHIEGVAAEGVRGRVRMGQPRAWEPGTSRERFHADPLVLDSAMQLSGYVAWVRYRRAGTPVGLGRFEVWEALPPAGEVIAEVRFGAAEGDRFSGTIDLLHPDDGRLLARASDVVAELRQVEGAPEVEEPLVLKPEWSDPSRWKEVQDLENRLSMAAIAGIRNPYFRVQQGTARDTTVIDGREYINFSSYNYVGFSGDPRVVEAVHAAVERFGTSVSASRVASGERPFHGELELMLAQAQRSEDALLFTAGHATNVTTIGHLFGPEDLIVHDAYIHDSGLQGIRLSGAARRGFAHDDPAACEAELKKLRRHYRRCLILVEGVYSMDGDIAQVPAYADLKRRYGCMLMVDEAHSFGIIGQRGLGVADHFDLRPGDVDIYMGTLSKSLASCGGWIAASKKLIQYLRYTAPGFVFSAGLTPANGVAALRSMQLLLEEPWRVHKLQSNASFFQKRLAGHGVDTGPADGESGVVPAITGNSMWALQLSQRLVDAGINVQPIVYPAVPDDAARLRFFLSSTHSEAQLAHTADTTAATLAQVRQDFPLPKKR